MENIVRNTDNISDEFRQLLMDFSATLQLQQPENPVIFAKEYFRKLLDEQNNIDSTENMIELDELPTAEDRPSTLYPIYRARYMRKSILAETYNPEDDETTPLEFYTKTQKEMEILRDAFRKVIIFRSLEEDQIDELINAAFPKIVNKHDVIIQEGDVGDNFYVIEHGVFHVFKTIDGKEINVKEYNHSGSFGELALLYNEPRAATVRAASNAKLWTMTRPTFRKIVVQSTFKKRKMYDSMIAKVPMLESLKPYERMNLSDALVSKVFNDCEIIIKQGDIPNGMYFIVKGEVQVTILNEDGVEVEIKRMLSGEYFGELALVTHRTRAASVYAVGRVKTAFIDVDTFERMLGPCMHIMKRNVATYEEQLMKIFGHARESNYV